MAKLKKGILSTPAEGKIGNLVVYTMNGNTYIRTRPSQYKDKKSTAQLQQRRRFDLVLRFLKPLKDLIRIGFANDAIGRTAFQAAQSYHLKHAINNDDSSICLDYSKTLLCKGAVPLPQVIDVYQKEDRILIKWENSSSYQNNRDALIVAAYKDGLADFQLTGIIRSKQEFEWKTPLATKKDIHFWLAFRSYKEDDVSDSLYFKI
jgi:hypothetical protein